MSQPSIHSVTCPACGHVQPFTAWGSINAAIEPSLRAALLDGQLEVFACAACRKLTRMAFDTLYHDMENRFMIWLAHEGDPLDPPDQRLPAEYRFRVVRTMPGLIEKVRIFEDGFDDRLMELFNVALWSSLEPQQRGSDGRLYYAGTRAAADPNMEFLLIRPESVDRLRVSKAEQFLPFQQQVSHALQVATPAHVWLNINEEYATAILTRPR
jgi:hypothetical protein